MKTIEHIYTCSSLFIYIDLENICVHTFSPYELRVFLAKPGDPFEDLFGSPSLSFPMMELLKNYVMLFQPVVHLCRLCEDYSITAGGWRLCLQELCSFGCHRGSLGSQKNASFMGMTWTILNPSL